jgi:hypothetical protein
VQKVLSVYRYSIQNAIMPRFHQTVPIDDYVLDVLMRDIVGHDQQPAAFLVYLYLSGRAVRQRWRPVNASLRMLADENRPVQKCSPKRPRYLAFPPTGEDIARSFHRGASPSRVTTLAIKSGHAPFSEVISIPRSTYRRH